MNVEGLKWIQMEVCDLNVINMSQRSATITGWAYNHPEISKHDLGGLKSLRFANVLISSAKANKCLNLINFDRRISDEVFCAYNHRKNSLFLLVSNLLIFYSFLISTFFIRKSNLNSVLLLMSPHWL